MKIGFIGFGEAAFHISLGLGGEGVREIVAFDAMATDPVMGQLVHDRAEQANVTLRDTATVVAQEAEVLFASVPSSYTLDVCRSVVGTLRPGQLYVDVSASTPLVKGQVWQLVQDTGVLFVDAAMLGSLPQDKHKVPITASGNGAQRFLEVMSAYHMDITVAGERPGDASAIKLVRSIYMKGIASLMVEMLQGAVAYGVEEEVVSSIATSMDGIPFQQHLDRLVTGSALHCKRRAAELKGSVSMLREAGLDPRMTQAAMERLEGLAPYDFAARYIQGKPKGWSEIIQLMKP